MIIKVAGAGAGKTTTMAERIIAKHKELPRDKNIYCITFTNNAVCCITEKLNKYYGIIPPNIKLSTIHSFLYQDIIKPYYYLLYGKQFERISSIELSSEARYRRSKISELERSGILHVTVFTERAKWVVCKKSTDRKKDEDNRKTLLNNFKKYCGHIFIDEAQDMDKNMLDIVKKFHDISIPMELIGDPKQDLKGFESLQAIVKEYPEQTEYINNCYRCPQKHLDISNTLIAKSEKQKSEKREGSLAIYFESEIDVKTFVTKGNFDLMYISRKDKRYNTRQRSENISQTETLFHEIEKFFLINDLTKDKSELLIKQSAYYFAIKLVKVYRDTKDSKVAMKELGRFLKIDPTSYARIIEALKINKEESDCEIVVSSIDRVKGQGGENCLFILTKDLAPYLFLEKKTNNKIKNRLYVALTRSLNKMSIVISEEVEKSYKKDFITDFFDQYI